MPKRYDQACPVARSLEVVGDRWTLLIVRDLLRGTQRFQDLLESLAGIAPNILSDRLKWMEERGLVTRELYQDRPPRAQYTLTERGRELRVVVGALAQWGTQHVDRRASLVHATCGHEVRLHYECPDCGGQVQGSEVTVTRSPRRARKAGATARRA
jgi:DNA-binding HxlR family transcriptional regulator